MFFPTSDEIGSHVHRDPRSLSSNVEDSALSNIFIWEPLQHLLNNILFDEKTVDREMANDQDAVWLFKWVDVYKSRRHKLHF